MEREGEQSIHEFKLAGGGVGKVIQRLTLYPHDLTSLFIWNKSSLIFSLSLRKRSGSMWIRVWSVWSAVWTGCWRENGCRATAVKTSSCLTNRPTLAREVARAMRSGSTLVTGSSPLPPPPPWPHHNLFQLNPLQHYYHHPHHSYWTLHVHPVLTLTPVGSLPVWSSFQILFKNCSNTTYAFSFTSSFSGTSDNAAFKIGCGKFILDIIKFPTV